MSKDYSSIALDIINNPSKHVVNRAEKMERTIDVMVSNERKKALQAASAVVGKTDEGNRGYGLGRKMGD